MKKTICIILATAFAATLQAAVPLAWNVETTRAQPAAFDCYRGETLDLRASLYNAGIALDVSGAAASLYWQTNGMGEVYWSAPATAASNVLSATWAPTNDVGAANYNCFIGVAGEIYRAAFRIRMLPSPGAVPSELDLPAKSIDFAAVTVLNAPYYTQGEVDSALASAAQAATNYVNAVAAGKQDTISDLAAIREGAELGATALQSESDPVWTAEKGGYATTNALALKADDADVVHRTGDETMTGDLTINKASPRLLLTNGANDLALKIINGNKYIATEDYDYQLPHGDGTFALTAGTGHKGNLAALDARGNPVDSGKSAADFATAGALSAAAQSATNYTDSATNAIPRIKEEDITWLYGYSGITNRVNSKGEMYTLEPPYGMWREYNKSSGVLVGEFLYKGWVTDFGGDYIWTNRFRYGSAISYNPATGKISGGGDNLGNFTAHMNPENGTFVMPEPIVGSFKWVYVPSGGYSETYYDRYAKESELSTKQDTIGDLAAIRSGAALGATALQSYTETDPTVPAWAKAASKPTYAYSEITGKPTFATVATSGSYNDLTDKPTIPSPTAPVASATLAWQSNGSAIVVSVGAAGTLSATLTGWIEGQTQTALITLAAGASISSEVKLVGYGTWPTGGQFLASATRVGNNVYVTPIVLVN